MRIINLIGASGSGKTSVADELGLHVVQSYTTRPRRYEGERGHTFIDKARVISSPYLTIKCGNVIEAIHLEDVFAYALLYDELYFATTDLLQAGDNVYIVNPGGAIQVEDYFRDTEIEVVTIYLDADESVRRERLSERTRDGIESRLERDRAEFSIVRCNWVVDANRPLKEVVEDVRRLLYGG